MKVFPRIAPLLALLAALLAAPLGATANVVEDLTVAEMSVRSDLVVHGRVRSVEAAWDEGRTRILTTVRLEVLATLAGEAPAEVVVRQAGGRVGDTELVVAGQPTFVVGQQVVVFLERNPDLDQAGEPAYVVLCMAAGLFRVTHDRATGEVVLGRDLAGLGRVRVGPSPAVRDRVARPLLLRDLVAEVRRARGEGGGR